MTVRRTSIGTNLLLSAGVLAMCCGCGMPYPPRPPYPPPYPIGQPVGQPIGQPVGQPVGQPISQPIGDVFLVSGTPEQQKTFRDALARCDFPFERLRPGMQRQGISAIRISWLPTGEGTLGWASTAGEIGISSAISGTEAHRTIILELGHIVDFFYMTPQMRSEVLRLWHPGTSDEHGWLGSTRYWDRVGEAYSALFLWAFGDEELWFDAGYSHKPTEELAARLREILLPGRMARN